MVVAPSLPQPGDVLGGRYVLQERIGEGGMGIVFRAEQPSLGRTVAIKILHPELATDAVFARRFRHEARAASRVRHPRSVTVLDCDFTNLAAPFIAMEYVAGRTLGRIIGEGALPLPRVLEIADQILWALEATHASGVIHADVKSDNFLIEERPEGDRVTMMDFGLAMIDGLWIDSGFVSGTPEYLAPELIRGNPPTVASDLYGVGVILYEMLTGTAPFTGGSSQEILSRQLEDEVIPPSLRRPDRDIPPVLDEIVLRALDKDPRRRYANAAEFGAALRAVSQACEASARVRCQACSARPDGPTVDCRTCAALVRTELAHSRSDTPTRNCGAPRPRRGARPASAGVAGQREEHRAARGIEAPEPGGRLVAARTAVQRRVAR